MIIFFSKIAISQKEIKDSVCFFVPNNLSINDEEPWQIVFSDLCKFQKFNFQLYNRWGSILFEAKSTKEANSFNPFQTQKNPKNVFETGTYYWKITYLTMGSDVELKQEGFLNIIH